MPSTYREFRQVLQRRGFRLLRSGKHETWLLEVNGQQVAIVRVSHQHGKEIPPPLFREIVKGSRTILEKRCAQGIGRVGR